MSQGDYESCTDMINDHDHMQYVVDVEADIWRHISHSSNPIPVDI